MTTRNTTDHEHGLREQVERWRIAAFGLIAALIYVAIALVFPVPASPDPEHAVDWPLLGRPSGTWLEVRSAFGAALISFAGFSAVLQIFQHTSLTREIEATVTRVLAGNTPILDKFSPAVKRDFVRSSLESALGPEVGAASFRHVSTMMDEGAVFRRGFEYRVWIRTGAPDALAGEAWQGLRDPARYCWVHEDLAYQRYLPHADSFQRGPFEVAVTFDSDTLSSLFADQTLFARFLIQLEPEEMERYSRGERLVDFVREVCALVASSDPDGARLATDALQCVFVPAQRNGGLGYVRVRIPISLSADRAARLRLQLRYPYRRSARHFTFSMPQPVEAPSLEFNAAGHMAQVAAIPYLGVAPGALEVRCIDAGETPRYEVRVAHGVWVFPTSGITFVWADKDEGATSARPASGMAGGPADRG